MGRRKRKTIAWSEAARKRIKAYWDMKSEETAATPTPSTSTCGEAGGAGDTIPLRITPSPADEASPPVDFPVSTPAMERERFLAGKLDDEGDVDDDNALLVISVRRLKELLRGNTCDVTLPSEGIIFFSFIITYTSMKCNYEGKKGTRCQYINFEENPV